MGSYLASRAWGGEGGVGEGFVGGREVCVEGLGVSLSEADFSADLGGSSKYSNENFEG